jgi:hypothetical protein
MTATFRGRVVIVAGATSIPGRADLTCDELGYADKTGAATWRGDITVDRPELLDGHEAVDIVVGRRTAAATLVGVVNGCDGSTVRVHGTGEPPF